MFNVDTVAVPHDLITLAVNETQLQIVSDRNVINELIKCAEKYAFMHKYLERKVFAAKMNSHLN